MSAKIKKIKESIKETLERSSLNALTKIASNKYLFIKLMWSVFLLITIAGCSWLLQKTLKDYLSWDVVSKVNIDYRNEMIMPVITICNLNPSFNEISETIMCCFDSWDPQRNCNLQEDFEIYYDWNYGNCFRYNSGRRINGSKVPYKYTFLNGNGFEFVLYTPKYSTHSENGFSIIISNYSLTTYSMDGVGIMPGFYTKISVDKYSISKKPYPYSNCIGNLLSVNAYPSDLYRKTFEIKHRYHQLDCHFMCIQRIVGNNCGCQEINDDLIYFKNMPHCNENSSTRNCSKEYQNKFFKNNNIKETCDCPLECEISGYTTSTSFLDFLTNKSIQFLSELNSIQKIFPNKTDRNLVNFKKTLAKVSIYYSELRETTITQEAKMSAVDLISSFGGILGFCMGLSLLSFVEILEIFFQMLIILR